MSACTMRSLPERIHHMDRAHRDQAMLEARRWRNSMTGLSHRPATHSSEVLPSLQSLNLLTPPNSAEQKLEENWHNARSDVGDGDFLVQHDDTSAYLPASRGLFNNSATSSPISTASQPHSRSVPQKSSRDSVEQQLVTLQPITSYASRDSPYHDESNSLAPYNSPQRPVFDRLGVQEPSVEDRQLCADFFLTFKGIEHAPPSSSTSSHWLSAPTRTHGLSPKHSRGVLRPVSMNSQSPTFSSQSPQSLPPLYRLSRPASEDLDDYDYDRVSYTEADRQPKLPIHRVSRHQPTSSSSHSAMPKRRRNHSTGISSGKRRGSSDSHSASSRQQKHVRGKPSKQRRSTNYLDYPDYAPPTSVMVNPIECAKNVKYATFKDSLDFGDDEFRDQMHDAEIIAATRCHLNGAQYLCTKRQIFEAFVQYLRGERKGNWNKTAAQLVAGIDVQKSSKLWQFFSDVGWFDPAHFQKFL